MRRTDRRRCRRTCGGGRLGLKPLETAGLSNIAATVANLLGLHKHDKWDDSLLELK